MTQLPPPLGSGELDFWRLDRAVYAPGWDSGERSYRVGGRWSPRGRRVVYAALDPATAILEVAVHTTFQVLDTVAHVLTAARIADSAAVHAVDPADVPNPDWLRPGMPGAGQQSFGEMLVSAYRFVLLPSVVSTHSWIAIFDPEKAAGRYTRMRQEPFVLDPRLHGGVR